jgi:hypothetical protein
VLTGCGHDRPSPTTNWARIAWPEIPA